MSTPRTDALLQDAGNDPYETGWIEHARQLETELAAVTAERDALKVEYESRAIWIDRMNVILGCVNTDGRNCKDVHQVAAALVAERDALKAKLERYGL